MQVEQGIKNDYNRKSWTILLDETDLARMAGEYGFYAAPGENGLTTDQAMLLLSLEAERYVLVQSPKYRSEKDMNERSPDEFMVDVANQITANREQFAGVIAEVTGLELEAARRRVGLPERQQ